MKIDSKNSKDLVEVKWLKSHPGYSYSAGNICYLLAEDAKFLLDGGYVSLAKGEIERIAEEAKIAEEEMLDVIFNMPHPEFSDSKGSIGKVSPENAKKLLKDNYVDLLSENETERNEIFQKLGFTEDPIRKTDVREPQQKSLLKLKNT